jgi:uncharacterized protein YndB with AHSA1/START domain
MSQSTTTAPIRLSVTVGATPERAFTAFTREMGTWWPFAAHSIYEDRADGVIFEERVGGRVIEQSPAGEDSHWADVLVWEPPRRFVLAWKPNPEAAAWTEVQVTFTSTADGTRVDLEHRGWERFGDEADERRAGYASENGWPAVLGEYVRAIS